MSSFICSGVPLNFRNKLPIAVPFISLAHLNQDASTHLGLTGHCLTLLSLFVASTITSSNNSIQASEMPFWTRSRAAAAAEAIVGKEETATVVGSAGESLRVAVREEG